ncbi:Phenylalanyl-tRNA synthetase beta chain [Caldalkalibacillus thermarum TA2.A1]|uniref:Phenylalanine--tRNA ligase beta subunit n=1 Tax=Caldalkalibacillus thermarum (strain TA2.A1) TaxID=986075 RepID=F5L8B9_CALTT|nr:phenylalanine--tRNA ligase subunit beta [Caldalkalibacillus thermarum]EGL82439.1 Phenylalanyl-tRNA synthetase beta chain [Caldalkalibacillus thermarum TA2.A1]
MLVSYNWLRQYVDLSDVAPEELAERLTKAGIEVEQVIKRGAGIKDVVIGYVVEREKHPNADKLSVCQVDLGEGEPVQIVCGAKNVAQGQKVPVAKVGAVLPGNFKIKKAKLRGEVSEGMICSAQELGIDERFVAAEHKEGIMVLPGDAQVGEDAIAYLGLDDTILELSLTPNRSDCLSMLGVAYEVAAILDRDVHLPDINLAESSTRTETEVTVQLDAPDLCPYYVARKITGVKIGPSPMWLQNFLVAAGIRPINNVVDVTNYVMLEYGQPLHAFDASRVKDGRIIVRKARQGEKVVTLDDQERTLSEGMLLITDPEKIIAVAGVMGAANSEVTAETTDVILESAYFDSLSIRTTSKMLGLRSEASTRFEKGVDPERVQEACDRAAALLAELAGGIVLSGTAQQKVKDFRRQRVSLHLVKLNNVLGTQLNTGQVTAIFDRLGFDYENLGHEISVEVPTRRSDITIEEDLIEEVARLYGYDNIPTTLPKGRTTPGARTPKQCLRQQIKRYLQGAGLDQVVTYSLTSEQYALWGSWFEEDVEPIKLAMPMSEERSHLRTTLIPSLLEVVQYNKNRKQTDLFLFEIGRTFLTKETHLRELPREKEVVAGVLTGLWQSHPWQHVKVPVDFYVAKGVVEGLLHKLGIQGVQFKAVEREHYHPGRTAEMVIGRERIGFVGQIHPQVQRQLELNEVYAFELDIEQLFNHLPGQVSFDPLPKFPSIQRDLAVVVSKEITAGELLNTIKDAGAPLLKHVHVFDVYTGQGIAAGKQSIAFSLTYFDPERTLTDEEVHQVHQRIVERLAEKWGAVLR